MAKAAPVDSFCSDRTRAITRAICATNKPIMAQNEPKKKFNTAGVLRTQKETAVVTTSPNVIHKYTRPITALNAADNFSSETGSDTFD